MQKYRILVSILIILSLIFTFIPVAKAQESLVLTISPIKIELKVNKGQILSQRIKIMSNLNTQLIVYTQDWQPQGAEGQVQFLTEKTLTSASSWLSISPKKFYLKANQPKEVKVSIQVPKDIYPGSYYTAVMFQPVLTQNKGVIQVVGRVGTLILLTVKGQVIEKGKIISFKTIKKFNWKTPVDFEILFKNTGTVYYKPSGKISIYLGDKKIDEIEIKGENALPNYERKMKAQWNKNVWLGKFTAQLDLKYGLKNDKTSFAETSFWVISWRLLIIIFLVIVLIGILVWLSKSKFKIVIVKK